MSSKISKKLQRSEDYFFDTVLKTEVQCSIAEYHLGQMIKDGLIVAEKE